MEDKQILNTVLIVLGIFIALFLLPMLGFMGFGHYGIAGMMAGFFFAGFLFMLLFWVVIIIALVLFITWLIRQLSEGKKHDKYIKRNEKKAK